MLKKTITFTNIDDIEVTQDFYFNLTKAEVLEMELRYEGGLEAFAARIAESSNPSEVYEEFKHLLLFAIGRRDGTSFVKNERIREEFAASEAYSEMLIEMINNADLAAEFFNGIMPAAIRQEVKATEVREGKLEITPELKAKAAKAKAKAKAKPTAKEEPKSITREYALEMDSDSLTSFIASGGVIKD